jgi:hypothetical protein
MQIPRIPGPGRSAHCHLGKSTPEGGFLRPPCEDLRCGGRASEALRWATTPIVLEPSGKPARGESGTLRAENLAEIGARYFTTSVCAIVVGCTRHTSR